MPNDLENVAGKLVELSHLPEFPPDAYARSAFNRYYYSTFLEARKMLCAIDVAWERTAHKSYPDHLKGKMLQKLKKKARILRNTDDYSAADILDAACHGLPELAKIMEEAYNLRVVADYEPDIKVNFDDRRNFSLNNISIEAAKSWTNRASRIRGQVLKAWSYAEGV